MKTSLYLTGFEKEIIKNDLFYKLIFFDTVNGLVFKTYIEETALKNDYLKLIDNANPQTIEELKKEVLRKCLALYLP